MAVLNDDVNQIERFLNTGANDLIQVFVSSMLVGAIFFSLTASTAVLALLPVPLILFGAFWFQKRLYPRYAAAREAAAKVSSRLDNNLHGMSTIQAYTAEDFEAEHLREASDAYRQRNREAIRFSAAITPVIRMAILAGFVMTLLYGGMLVLQGRARRRQLFGAGVPDPAPAVADDAPGRHDRPVPARHGLGRPRAWTCCRSRRPRPDRRPLPQPAKGALRFEHIALRLRAKPGAARLKPAHPGRADHRLGRRHRQRQKHADQTGAAVSSNRNPGRSFLTGRISIACRNKACARRSAMWRRSRS